MMSEGRIKNGILQKMSAEPSLISYASYKLNIDLLSFDVEKGIIPDQANCEIIPNTENVDRK